MTATSPVSAGRSTSPGSSRSQRIPRDSRVPATGPFAPTVAWAAVSGALSVIAGALTASMAPDTLTTARIATPTGIMQVHHG
jgi:hypothetical protein